MYLEEGSSLTSPKNSILIQSLEGIKPGWICFDSCVILICFKNYIKQQFCWGLIERNE